ncbi:hypothetical protein N7466_004680 [Penicillium verhagenii]|uniref:uncharacterized protein n=1 Tax=Penicillium verhagenii TaxID=1562060 RepID=UPI002544E708|nr:uncharacterized protein N7466_004680 [Penicillium verhagenii]KAJ5935133.1 hypothetical protein N7466_004680 [Penicillium verhagenii]
MSWDRVLPAPAGLQHENTQVRPSDLLDHKIMNDRDLPMSHGSLVYRPDSFKYADLRSTDVAHAHQQMTVLNQGKIPNSRSDQNDMMAPMANTHNMSSMRRPSGPMVSTKELSRSSSSSGSASPVRSAKERDTFCLCQPDPKIPRPRNAFILYRQHYQATVVAHNPGMANPNISKIIGEQWRHLSEDEKSKWRTLAEEEKIRHNQQYPGYRYQPRRSGRDGGARGSGSGISNNPSGGTHCTRCGGRFMHPPSPMTPFTPTTVTQEYREYRPSGLSTPITHKSIMTASSSHSRERDEPKLVKIDSLGSRSRSRQAEEVGGRSPDNKRRRVSHTPLKPMSTMGPHRDRSPDGPYSAAPYSARPDMQPRNMLPMIQRQFNNMQGQSHIDQSLKLPPLQTGTPVMTPITPNFSTEPSVEATVMTIPFLNKIKVLAKISPPLVPSFRESTPQIRGPVIAVDGHDPELVQVAVQYLQRLLRKEPKYHVRVFDGPDIKPQRDSISSSEGGPMGDATVDYLDTISAWHRISDEVVSFVKSISTAMSVDSRSSPEEESNKLNLSPKSLIPKTAGLQIHSPAQSSENGSDTSVSPSTLGSPCTMPIALVPRYQISTADAFACSIPIHDSYAPLDHWQWMASLWRACVGPDITVYIRECSREELERAGGNAVEVRLHDARTIILRKVVGSSRELEEKALKRVGFEIEDFLTQ